MIEIIEIKYRDECFEHFYVVKYKIVSLFKDEIMLWKCLSEIKLTDKEIKETIENTYLDRLNKHKICKNQ